MSRDAPLTRWMRYCMQARRSAATLGTP